MNGKFGLFDYHSPINQRRRSTTECPSPLTGGRGAALRQAIGIETVNKSGDLFPVQLENNPFFYPNSTVKPGQIPESHNPSRGLFLAIFYRKLQVPSWALA